MDGSKTAKAATTSTTSTRHPAASRRNYPNQWFRYDKAQELVAELNVENHTIEPINSKRGRYGGTFVVEELVYTCAILLLGEALFNRSLRYPAFKEGRVASVNVLFPDQ